MAQDDQSDYQSDMRQMVNGVAQKVGAVLTAYAHEHGYTVVLDASQTQANTAPVVLYANPSIDITKAVVAAYNAKSGIPAPPPPAPTPAAHKPAAK
jgi:outer membrane protein